MCDEGHFDSKAMPSAGLLPFFQSMFCAANNTCHQTERPSEQAGHVDNYNTSLYVSLSSGYSRLHDGHHLTLIHCVLKKLFKNFHLFYQ